MNTLNVAFLTSRQQPHHAWALDSLWPRWQAAGTPPLKLIFVDFHCAPGNGQRRFSFEDAARRFLDAGVPYVHCEPMPNVWQGRHRLTQRDYWAAATVHNTALCHALDGYIAFVDDLAVLAPGWLDTVLDAQAGGWIALGAYVKARELVVEDGKLVSFAGLPRTGLDYTLPLPAQIFYSCRAGNPSGVDTRLASAPNSDDPHVVSGSWMYGSVAAPVEAFLRVNGYDTDCDSMSGEDCICGLMIEQHGYTFKYCRRMINIESEELHHTEPCAGLRIIKGPPNDKRNKSHVMLDMVASGSRHTAPNYYGTGGLRALRDRILRGESFPVTQVPDRDWYDQQPLREM